MFVVVSYDVVNDRRRNKIADTLENYGTRVQKSVFECILEPPRLANLIKEVTKLLEEKEDTLRVYRLCDGCLSRVLVYGIGELTKDKEVYIV